MEKQTDSSGVIHRAANIDNLAIHIYENREFMGEDAADLVAGRINNLLEKQPFVNIVFAAAPSQNEFLAALTQKHIDWSRINAFHMDEYLGLPENDARLFSSFLKGKIFDRLPFRSINLIDGNASDPEYECKRYTGLLLQNPTDIVCMGIGENAHIAFNDPHVADFNDLLRVKIVSLDPDCRQQQVNDGCFASLNEVPAHALTLTIPALMTGKYIYCMVPGEKKAKAVQHILHKEIAEKYPASILRKHPDAVLFLDENSSSMLSF